MRALDCDCGQHLEAADNEKLFDKTKEHVNRDHPEMQLGDEQVREIVAEKAYHKSDLWAGIDIPPRAAAYMGAGGMPPSSTRPEPRQKRQDSVQEAEEEQEGKKGLVDKLRDKLKGQ
jgi:predicted small metal-binding protein